ncbi:MAG: hypothetical protein MPJ50_11155 [Pirellulales bacterium]|nr:hypothetical protein [Pirellulales bacterium]
MKTWIALLLSLATGQDTARSAAEDDRSCVIVVVGAAAVEEYEDTFESWADRWQTAASEADARFIRIGGSKPQSSSEGTVLVETDREHLRRAIVQYSSAETPLWIVLIGHGTFDGQTAKFNLVGPDFTPQQLGEWLDDVTRPVAIVNCASASGPFVNELSAAERVIVTATRNGHELNYARFGDYISAAMNDASADLDKDDQVSLLEAYLTASKRVAEFYQTESRLATEHALLDDNGDSLGTPADWFRGVRATRRARDGAALDGARAHQFHLIQSQSERAISPSIRTKRDRIELDIAKLRDQKETLSEDSYYAQLEALMLKLAEIYKSLDALKQAG